MTTSIPKFPLYDDLVRLTKQQEYRSYITSEECEKIQKIFEEINDVQKEQLSYTIQLIINHYNNVSKGSVVAFEIIPYHGSNINGTVKYNPYNLPPFLQRMIFYLINHLSE